MPGHPGQSISSTPNSAVGFTGSSSELVSKVNLQLIQVLNQLEAKEEHCKKLKEELGKDREAFRTLVESLIQMTTSISRIFLKLVELQFKVPISAEITRFIS